jgi:hypothetical protein
MTDNATKKGRGRPKGSTSFVKVSVSDLMRYIGKDSTIMVSRKWLKDMGIEVGENNKTKVVTPVTEQEPQIQYRIS